MKKRTFGRQMAWIVAVVLVFGTVMPCLVSPMNLQATEDEYLQRTADIAAANWKSNSNCLTVTDAADGTQINAADNDDCWLANANYKQAVNVGKEFSITFSIDDFSYSDGKFAFRLTKNIASAAWSESGSDANGITLGGIWYEEGYFTPFGSSFTKIAETGDITMKLTKSETEWVVTFTRGESSFVMNRVPFTTLPADYFNNDKAYLSVFFLSTNSQGSVYYPVQFKIKNITDYLKKSSGEESEPAQKSVNIAADNWRKNSSSLTVTDAQDGTQINVANTGDCHLANAVLKSAVDVGTEVSLTFSIDEFSQNEGRFVFRLSKSIASSAWSETGSDANGISMGGIWYQSGYITPFGGVFTQIPASGDITMTLTPGASSWIVRFSRGEKSFIMNEVPYTSIARDYFKNDKAYLSLFFLNANGSTYYPGQFTVKSLTHYTTQSSGNTEEEGYDLDTYTQPYWEGSVMHNESVIPIANKDGSIDDIELMFDAVSISSVRDSLLSVTYEEGKDYELVDGKLRILPDGDIPIIPYSEYYPDTGWALEDGTHIVHTEGAQWVAKQLAVTYSHSDSWEYYIPTAKGYLLPKTIGKLHNKEKLNVVMYGDSISAGGNCSSALNISPWMPTFGQMFVDKLKKTYGYDDITFTNTSVGGTNVEWGFDNAEERVLAYNPDLVVIHFGTNNSHDPDYFAELMKKLVDKIKDSAPDAEIMIVSNPLPLYMDTVMYGEEYVAQLNEYEYSLLKLETEGVAVARATTVYEYVRAQKRFCDITANCVNHPNDFIHRLIAMTMIATCAPGGDSGDNELSKQYYVLPESSQYLTSYCEFDGKELVMDGGNILYVGSRLYNDMALFRMTVRKLDISNWIAVSVRGQGRVNDLCYNQECYAFLIKGDHGITLRKFGEGGGDLKTVYVEKLLDGKQWTIGVGSFDVENGVRLVLEIGGVVVMDYTDTSEYALRKAGYTGISLLNDTRITVKVGTKHSDTDEDIPNYQVEPGDKYSYVGNGFEHALGVLINRKNIIPDPNLVGKTKEDIPTKETDPDEGLMLDTFVAVNQINNGEKNAVFDFDITDKPIVDKAVWEAAQNPENAGKQLRFNYFDKDGNLMYSILIKCSDVKSCERINMSLKGAICDEKGVFADNAVPFGVSTVSEKIPGKMTVSYRPSSDWRDGCASDKVFLAKAVGTTLENFQKNLSYDEDGFITFNMESAGNYFLSDRLLKYAEIKTADNMGTNTAGKPVPVKKDEITQGASSKPEITETVDTEPDDSVSGSIKTDSDKKTAEKTKSNNTAVAAIILIAAAAVCAATVLTVAIVVKRRKRETE